jgi:hypothetical protein
LEIREGGLQMAYFCASMLTYVMYAPLRCSKKRHFRRALTNFQTVSKALPVVIFAIFAASLPALRDSAESAER